jgi:hypothetical protein
VRDSVRTLLRTHDLRRASGIGEFTVATVI